MLCITPIGAASPVSCPFFFPTQSLTFTASPASNTSDSRWNNRRCAVNLPVLETFAQFWHHIFPQTVSVCLSLLRHECHASHQRSAGLIQWLYFRDNGGQFPNLRRTSAADLLRCRLHLHRRDERGKAGVSHFI